MFYFFPISYFGTVVTSYPIGSDFSASLKLPPTNYIISYLSDG